jgi:uncharacterized protein YjiS (DUF1127 family)
MKTILNNIWSKITKAIETYGMNRVKKELEMYSMYNSTYKELQRLSDRELKDIGVVRGDIKNISISSSKN